MPKEISIQQKLLLAKITASLYELSSQSLNSFINLSVSSNKKMPKLNPNIYKRVYPEVRDMPSKLPKNNFTYRANEMLKFLDTHAKAMVDEGYGIVWSHSPQYQKLIDFLKKLLQSYTADPFEGLLIKINPNNPIEINSVIDYLYSTIFENKDSIFQNQLAYSFLYNYFISKIQDFFIDSQYFNEVAKEIKQSGPATTINIVSDILAYPMQRISRILLQLIELTNHLIKFHEFSEDEPIEVKLNKYINDLQLIKNNLQSDIQSLSDKLFKSASCDIDQIKIKCGNLLAQDKLIQFYIDKFTEFSKTETSFLKFMDSFSCEINKQKEQNHSTSLKPLKKLNTYLDNVNAYLDNYLGIETCINIFKNKIEDKHFKLTYKNEIIQINNEFYDYLDRKKKNLIRFRGQILN